jgi:Predicted outer membrane lipoprotein
MNRIFFPLAVTVLGAATSAAAHAGSAYGTYDEAPVLSSTPIYQVQESRIPRQECWEEQVQYQAPTYQSATPGLIGALVGGALGNAVGHHKRNKQVGAVVGAVIGGSIGSDIARNRSGGGTYYTDTVERCRTVYTNVQEEKLVGYDVRYSYNGVQRTVRMPYDPGSTVRVRVDVEPVF